MPKRVLSVGQCVPTTRRSPAFCAAISTRRSSRSIWPTRPWPRCARQPFDLVLINRKLDADYSDGLEILQAIKADPQMAAVPVMLVTNYAEHQDAAVAAGAVRGFGKLEYGDPQTLEKLRPFLA